MTRSRTTSNTQELAPGTEAIDRRNADVRETLKAITNNHGPDVGIEAAGFHYAKGLAHKVRFVSTCGDMRCSGIGTASMAPAPAHLTPLVQRVTAAWAVCMMMRLASHMQTCLYVC
jgi:NADPH:quinone reductase-like Zn-dependent oxidoreductase